MRQLIVSPAALADLREIWEFIATDDPAAADLVLDEVGGRLDLLLDSPLMGRQRPELAPGLRSFLSGRYVIFYIAEEEAVRVVRVLHGARDIEGLWR